MKRLLFCVLSLFFTTAGQHLTAQNGMFVPFGQSSAEFDEYLESRDYIRTLQRPCQDTVVNIMTRNHWATYLFDDEVLYAIEDVRIYQDEKTAERVVESCLDYLKLSDMRLRTLESSSGFHHYAIVEGDRIVELKVTRVGPRKERVTTVRMKATSRVYGPRLQTESYANRIVRN